MASLDFHPLEQWSGPASVQKPRGPCTPETLGQALKSGSVEGARIHQLISAAALAPPLTPPSPQGEGETESTLSQPALWVGLLGPLPTYSLAEVELYLPSSSSLT